MDTPGRCLAHFGLIAEPFGELSDRRFIWLGERHLEVIANLKVGVEQTRGVLLLTGAEGSGRRVLVESLIQAVGGNLQAAVLQESGIDAARFFDWLGEAFQLGPPGAPKGERLIAFKEFLKAARGRRRNVLLVVYGAEHQAAEILEQVRLLSNLEDGGEKLLSVLLVGTERLAETLSAPQHRALSQRVAVRCHLEALSEAETAAYIGHRMMAAGAFLPVFDEGALGVIHRFTGGLPRMIGVVCDHLLSCACRDGRRRVDAKAAERYVKSVGAGLGHGCAPERTAGARRAPRGSRAAVFAAALTALACLLLAAGIVREIRREGGSGPGAAALPSPRTLCFGPGPLELSPEAASALSWVAREMQRRPQLIAAVRAGCEGGIPDERCFAVSRARAEAVRDLLEERGLDRSRVIALGGGAEPPGGGASDGSIGHRVEIQFSTRLSR